MFSLLKRNNLSFRVITVNLVETYDIASVKTFKAIALISSQKIGKCSRENKLAFFRMDEYCILIA